MFECGSFKEWSQGIELAGVLNKYFKSLNLKVNDRGTFVKPD